MTPYPKCQTPYIKTALEGIMHDTVEKQWLSLAVVLKTASQSLPHALAVRLLWWLVLQA
jgi:hypothetical protein